LGGSDGDAYAINNAGQVVGRSATRAGNQHAFIVVPQNTNGDGKPDLWNPTGTPLGLNPLMTDLGVPSGVEGTTVTYALDVNDLGQVVGNSQGTNSDGSGWVTAWVVASTDANGDGQPDTWYQDDGTGANALMIPLRVGTGDNDCVAINNRGEIVGTSCGVGYVLIPVDANHDGQPDTWYQDADGDGLNDLAVGLGQALGLDGGLVNLAPSDINDAGQIVGYISYTPFLLTPKQTAVGPVWVEDLNGDGENDLIVRLPMPLTGSVGYSPLVVNNKGSIAGNFRTSKGTYHAILWRTDAQGFLHYTDLGVPNSETHIRSQGINDRDQVVGDALLYGTKASVRSWSGWLWDNGVMKDVRTLMDKSAELTDRYMFAAGINNAGLMVGFAGAVTVGSTGGPAGYYPWIAVPTH
jgi:probable HAF family extracellular repeat protein